MNFFRFIQTKNSAVICRASINLYLILNYFYLISQQVFKLVSFTDKVCFSV